MTDTHTAILANVHAADRHAFFPEGYDPEGIVTLATGLASEAVCGSLDEAATLAEHLYGIPRAVSHMLADAAMPVLYPLASRALALQLTE